VNKTSFSIIYLDPDKYNPSPSSKLLLQMSVLIQHITLGLNTV